MTPTYEYVPMTFLAAYESLEAAVASVCHNPAEAAEIVAEARASGENVLRLYVSPTAGGIAPTFRFEQGPGGVAVWAGDTGSAKPTVVEAQAFLDQVCPREHQLIVTRLAEAGGRDA